MTETLAVLGATVLGGIAAWIIINRLPVEPDNSGG